MKLKGLIVIFTLFCTTINAQIISQFTWDSNPVTKADIGPDATSVSPSATSSPGGVGGTNGLNAGLPKMDLDFIIPTISGAFDVAGIDISFDFQRDESSGTFFKRGNSLIIDGTKRLSVSYRVDDGAGGFNTINSGDVYNIPDDNTFRNYRFYYLPSTGYGALLVDGIEVWSNDGADKRDMYWKSGDDIIIGDNLDGSGTNRTALDNLIIGNVSTNPLPVELVRFNVKQNNKEAQIEWKTATEINNDFFTIERSIDAISWEFLTEINGAGNSSSSLNYQTTDDNPYLGLSYYRLKQTDFNGKSSYSSVKSLNITENPSSSIKIYPNPAESQITVSSDVSNLTDLRILNVLGQDVTNLVNLKSNESQIIIVDLSNLETGIYFVNVNSKTTKVYKK